MRKKSKVYLENVKQLNLLPNLVYFIAMTEHWWGKYGGGKVKERKVEIERRRKRMTQGVEKVCVYLMTNIFKLL